MVTKLFTVAALGLAVLTLYAGFTQQAALTLRQENQTNYWPRHGTALSGSYRSGIWLPSPERATYSSFRGGGPGAGK